MVRFKSGDEVVLDGMRVRNSVVARTDLVDAY